MTRYLPKLERPPAADGLGGSGTVRASLFVIAILLAALTGCASSPPTPLQLDRQLMTATTSPIPGATAKVLPAPVGAAANAPPANFCVTDAGYCPLAAAAAAGQNCICQAGSLMYGGKTNTAPQTYKAPLFGGPTQPGF